MNMEKMPPRFIEALYNRGFNDEQIGRLEGPDAFHEYCEWHGLIGFSDDLYRLAKICAGQE